MPLPLVTQIIYEPAQDLQIGKQIMVITMKVELGYLYSQLYSHCSPKASSFSTGTKPLRSNSVKILVSGSVSSFELKTLFPAYTKQVKM